MSKNSIWFEGERGGPTECTEDTPARVDGVMMPLGKVPPEVWDLEVYNGGLGWVQGNRTQGPVEVTLTVTIKVPHEFANNEMAVCRAVGRALFDRKNRREGEDIFYEIGVVKVVKPMVPMTQPSLAARTGAHDG